MYIYILIIYFYLRLYLCINIILIIKELIFIFYNENNKIVEKERMYYKKIKSLKNKYQIIDLYLFGVGISLDSVFR